MATIFTREELMGLKMKSLNRLAVYYKIPFKGKKTELVDALMGVLTTEEHKDEAPMSERVRRAKESLKNG